jgi:uncharacterized glyoxalase superfamily protein PhnB
LNVFDIANTSTFQQRVAAGLEVTFPPTDMPWNDRGMHLRHPDGHVFRVGRGFRAQR